MKRQYLQECINENPTFREGMKRFRKDYSKSLVPDYKILDANCPFHCTEAINEFNVNSS